MSTPTKVTGGCLCGAARYEINFKPDHDFKASSSICLCTLCRKQTGALATHFHSVPLHSFAWTSPPPSAYEVVPGNRRSFCAACGGYLAWQSVDRKSDAGEPLLEVCAGTIDEEFLVGRKDADGEVVPGTGFGELLCHAEAALAWAQNGVGSATKGIGGAEKFKFGFDTGVLC